MRNAFIEGLLREDKEELYTQSVTRVFTSQQTHLGGKALFLLGPHSKMPPALRGSVFDLDQDERCAFGECEIGLRKRTGMAVYGQPAVGHVECQSEFFGQPAAHVRMQALGKALEQR